MGKNRWSGRETSNPFVKEPTSSRSTNTQAAGYAGKAGFTGSNSGSSFGKGSDNTLHKLNDKGVIANSSFENKNHTKTTGCIAAENGTNRFRGQQGHPQHVNTTPYIGLSDNEVEEIALGGNFFGY